MPPKNKEKEGFDWASFTMGAFTLGFNVVNWTASQRELKRQQRLFDKQLAKLDKKTTPLQAGVQPLEAITRKAPPKRRKRSSGASQQEVGLLATEGSGNSLLG